MGFFFSFFLKEWLSVNSSQIHFKISIYLTEGRHGQETRKEVWNEWKSGVCCFFFNVLYKQMYFLYVLRYRYRFPPWWPELFRLRFSIWLLDGIQPSLSQWNQIREHLLLTAPAQSATGVMWRCVVWIWLQQWWERWQEEEEGKTSVGAHGRSHSCGKPSHLFFNRKRQLLCALWWA